MPITAVVGTTRRYTRTTCSPSAAHRTGPSQKDTHHAAGSSNHRFHRLAIPNTETVPPPPQRRTLGLATPRRMPRPRHHDLLPPDRHTRARAPSTRAQSKSHLQRVPSTHTVPTTRPRCRRALRNLGRNDSERTSPPTPDTLTLRHLNNRSADHVVGATYAPKQDQPGHIGTSCIEPELNRVSPRMVEPVHILASRHRLDGSSDSSPSVGTLTCFLSVRVSRWSSHPPRPPHPYKGAHSQASMSTGNSHSFRTHGCPLRVPRVHQPPAFSVEGLRDEKEVSGVDDPNPTSIIHRHRTTQHRKRPTPHVSEGAGRIDLRPRGFEPLIS